MFCFRTQRSQRSQRILKMLLLERGRWLRTTRERRGVQELYTIFVCHPTSALSRRSEAFDFSSVSAISRGIKPLRSLRSLREIYNHHTDVLFPHAEDAKIAKILLYNTIAREVAGSARQESAEHCEGLHLLNRSNCFIWESPPPAFALSRRSETCDSSSASVNGRGIKPLRSLRSLRETYNIFTTQMYFFPHAEHAKIAKILLYNTIA